MENKNKKAIIDICKINQCLKLKVLRALINIVSLTYKTMLQVPSVSIGLANYC